MTEIIEYGTCIWILAGKSRLPFKTQIHRAENSLKKAGYDVRYLGVSAEDSRYLVFCKNIKEWKIGPNSDFRKKYPNGKRIFIAA